MSTLPKIGITANLMHPDLSRLPYPPKTLQYWEEELVHWIEDGGAIPYLLPRLSNDETLRGLIEGLDGIVFSGGADISPKSYGEEALKPEWAGDYARDQYELKIFKIAQDLRKPILGICRGHQLINVALGGSLYQDTETQKSGAHNHRDGVKYDKVNHEVKIMPDTVLADIYDGVLQGRINSVHHQAVKGLGANLTPMAYSVPDEVIEAIWLDQADQYIMGIQWHPEWVVDKTFFAPNKIRAHFLEHIRQQVG